MEAALKQVCSWATDSQGKDFLVSVQPVFTQRDGSDSLGFAVDRRFRLFLPVTDVSQSLEAGHEFVLKDTRYRVVRIEPEYYQQECLYYTGLVSALGKERDVEQSNDGKGKSD